MIVGAVLVLSCGGSQTTPTDSASAAGSAKNPIGGACTADSGCQAGLFCDKNDPGGMCQKKCAATADCGAGAVCSDEHKEGGEPAAPH